MKSWRERIIATSTRASNLQTQYNISLNPHENITFDYIQRMEPEIPQQIGTVDVSDEQKIMRQLAVGEQKLGSFHSWLKQEFSLNIKTAFL